MDNKKIKVGITHGDINGIGYEIILKTLEDPRIAEICTPVVYGSAKIAATYRKMMELPEVKLTQIENASQADADNNYIINVVGESVQPEPGNALRLPEPLPSQHLTAQWPTSRTATLMCS